MVSWNPLRILARLLGRSGRAEAGGGLEPLDPAALRLVIGLGNPGQPYVHTRHNVGFMLVERLAAQLNASWPTAPPALQSRVARSALGERDVLLVMPRTFMNNSGEAVAALLQHTGVSLDQLLVVYDDMDLPLGRLRFRESGSAGTHNGMRSIVAALGDDRFPRLRLGIGHAGRGDLGARDYVLGSFSEAEQPAAEQMLLRASVAVGDWILEGPTVAMNRHNG